LQVAHPLPFDKMIALILWASYSSSGCSKSTFFKILPLLLLLPGAEACASCPGDPLLDTLQTATLQAPLLTFATINARSGLFAEGGKRLTELAEAMLTHTIHALIVTESQPPSTAAHPEASLRKENAAINRLKKSLNIHTISSSTSTTRGTVAILLHPQIAGHLPPGATGVRAANGRWLQIALYFPEGHILHLAGIYGEASPDPDNPAITLSLQHELTKFGHPQTELDDQIQGQNHFLLAGDANETLSPLDTTSPAQLLRQTNSKLLPLLEEHPNLVDTFRIHHPDTAASTFSSASQEGMHGSRLDYIFASPLPVHNAHTATRIDQCGDWLSFPSQDHRAVITQCTHFDHTLPTAPSPMKPPPLDLLDYTQVSREQWGLYAQWVADLLADTRHLHQLTELQATIPDNPSPLDRQKAFAIIEVIYRHITTVCQAAASTTLLPIATPRPPNRRNLTPGNTHPPRRSTRESNLDKFLARIAPFRHYLTGLLRATLTAFDSSLPLRGTKEYLSTLPAAPPGSLEKLGTNHPRRHCPNHPRCSTTHNRPPSGCALHISLPTPPKSGSPQNILQHQALEW
jgi:exonuclease III